MNRTKEISGTPEPYRQSQNHPLLAFISKLKPNSFQDIDFETFAEVHYLSETKTESLDPTVINLVGTNK